MWRNNLQNELCWYIEDPSRLIRNRYDKTEYIAPSWFWASVVIMAAGYPFEPQGSFLYEILSTITTPCGEDEMGQIAECRLTIRCESLFACQVSPCRIDDPTHIRINQVVFRGSVFFDRIMKQKDEVDLKLFLVLCYHESINPYINNHGV
jgi:hypothetical protein